MVPYLQSKQQCRSGDIRDILICLLQDFFLPSESFDLVFLKAKIAILCTKGFEIMDLNE